MRKVFLSQEKRAILCIFWFIVCTVSLFVLLNRHSSLPERYSIWLEAHNDGYDAGYVDGWSAGYGEGYYYGSKKNNVI